MKLYFASLYLDAHFLRNIRAGASNMLISVIDLRNGRNEISVEDERALRYGRAAGVEVFLDSGAFTYQQIDVNKTKRDRPIPMTLDQYCQFIKKYRQYFDVVAALDVIGDADASYENYMYMRKQGLGFVLPAWHGGEPLEAIDRYIGLTDYIGIGGVASIALDRIRKARYIQNAISYIRKRDPNMKIHLYGVADVALLRMFGHEVESIDSASWKTGAMWAYLLTLSGTKWKKYTRRVKNKHWDSTTYNIYQTAKMVEQINEYVRSRKHKVPYGIPLPQRRSDQ